MRKVVIAICLVCLFSIALSACAAPTEDLVPVSELSVEMSEFKFTPQSLVVLAGEEITLNLSNNGGVPHDFTILKKGAEVKTPFDHEKQADDILAEFTLGPQESGVYKFTLPEASQYQVVCAIQGHLESGMVAVLTAKEK